MTAIAHHPRPRSSARFLASAAELRALRAALEKQRQFRVEQLEELDASLQPGSPGPPDDPQQAVALALRAGAADVLTETVEALSRLDEDRYGLCQACGEAISLARLRALPMLRWCGACQHVNVAPSRVFVAPRQIRGAPAVAPDIVDVWGLGSFPASDPPANW